MLEYSLKIDFKVTNNQVEYEALVASLQLAKEIRAWSLNIRNDSQLVIAQLKGEYEVKKSLLVRYSQMAKNLLENFDYDMQKILREENSRVDVLTKLASAKAVINNKMII